MVRTLVPRLEVKLGERRQSVGVRLENMGLFYVPAHPNPTGPAHGAKRFMRQREQNDHDRAREDICLCAGMVSGFAMEAYDDFHQLVRSDNVDIVTVCVRVPFHLDVVMAALEAGKHVMCEWRGVTTISSCNWKLLYFCRH